ncbi:major capsid protein [Desulfovibrio piger]|uniref:major capsid protein n=1 Tax=Desulfovibrio piger TaxID=901 RepID=UPI0025DB096A|nr:hypothetical protein [Desulfovibrio piger]
MSATLGFVATLAEMEQFYRGDKAGQIIELMNKTNDIMDDVPWMEANQSDGHLTRIRTGLPAVYWRRLYQGTPPAKSQWSQVKEGCGILEAIMELDVEEIRLYGDRDRSFRMSEGIAFAEAMRQKVARTLFYGDSNRNPDEFNGLAMRYPASDAENVLDAGGRDGGCTSLWLVSWGPQSVHGIYPKGSRGGLSHEDLKTYMAQDGNGRKYQVTGDKYNWRCGLAVRDWRGVVRIANVPVAALGKRKGEEGFVDLQKLTIEAKNRMPQHLRRKAVWYANADVLTALELQNSDAGQVQLHYGEFFDARAVPVLHGRPVRQCDAIASDEASI